MSVDETDPATARDDLVRVAGAVYLDVRSRDEFDAGHPEGAWNIPLLHRGPTGMEPNAEFADVARATLPSEALILVGCQSGGRSRRACELLHQLGFQRVTNVTGGWGGAVNPRTGAVIAPGWHDLGLPSATRPLTGRSWSELRARAGT